MTSARTTSLQSGAFGRDMVLFQALLRNASEYLYFKDRESRFIAVSTSLVHALGKQSPADVIGRTDFDFYDEAQAKEKYEDEQRVMRTGEPILEKPEIENWPTSGQRWALTTKLPLRDRAGNIVGTFGISRDITEMKKLETELETAHRDLLDASRAAGMAEVANGVLHNVGNVLNSLNVSASVLASGLRQSKAESLVRLAALIREHEGNLATFLSDDPKGRRVPEFLGSLAQHSAQERDRLLVELGALQKNIDHIKEIVAMQQAYATMVGVVEALEPRALLEDAVRMNSGALHRHEVSVERVYEETPHVLGEQAKILQILVNLIRNAKHACDDSGRSDKRITLRLCKSGEDRVQLVVSDNGVGIPPENLTRIFQHGFTTRAKGHGFGLHSAAIAARELKGSLTVASEGAGLGATFTLELPAAPASPVTP